MYFSFSFFFFITAHFTRTGLSPGFLNPKILVIAMLSP